MLMIPACATLALCLASALIGAGLVGHIILSKPTHTIQTN